MPLSLWTRPLLAASGLMLLASCRWDQLLPGPHLPPQPSPTASFEPARPASPLVSAPPSSSPEPGTLAFRRVVHDKTTDQFIYAHLENAVLRSDADIEALAAKLGLPASSPFIQDLKLDFAQETGLLAALPLQPDTGPDISVRRITDLACLQVAISRRLPPAGQGAGATMTMPYEYVAIARTDKPVCFEPAVDAPAGQASDLLLLLGR